MDDLDQSLFKRDVRWNTSRQSPLPGQVEWAVGYQSLTDGPIDTVEHADSEEEAREEAANQLLHPKRNRQVVLLRRVLPEYDVIEDWRP